MGGVLGFGSRKATIGGNRDFPNQRDQPAAESNQNSEHQKDGARTEALVQPMTCKGEQSQDHTELQPYRAIPTVLAHGGLPALPAFGIGPQGIFRNRGPIRSVGIGSGARVWRDLGHRKPGQGLPGKGTTRAGSLLDWVFRSDPKVIQRPRLRHVQRAKNVVMGPFESSRAGPFFPCFGKVLASAPPRHDSGQGLRTPVVGNAKAPKSKRAGSCPFWGAPAKRPSRMAPGMPRKSPLG